MLWLCSPFTLEEKQVLLETKNLNSRKSKIADILTTYTFDQYTIQPYNSSKLSNHYQQSWYIFINPVIFPKYFTVLLKILFFILFSKLKYS